MNLPRRMMAKRGDDKSDDDNIKGVNQSKMMLMEVRRVRKPKVKMNNRLKKKRKMFSYIPDVFMISLVLVPNGKDSTRDHLE